MPGARPRVTIVVPSFEQGRFLPSALRSILSQTESSIESLVYDNQSGDETPSVLAAFSGRMTRVTVAKDQGQSSALNRGFREARGDVIGWLNADDMLMPNAVERALRALADTGADIVYGQCAHLDASGQFTGYFPFTRAFDRVELLDYNNFIPQPATFFRRSLLDRVGLLDEGLRYTMDWDLWCRFAGAGAKFQFVPEVWAGARIHQAAKTSRGGMARLVEICAVNERHRTNRVPLVPFLYLAYRLNGALGLERVLRVKSWWRAMTGGNRSVVAYGVAEPSVILADAARMHYPNYENLERLTVDLDDGEYPAAVMTANGQPMVRHGRIYQSESLAGREPGSLAIEITRVSRPLPAPFLVRHQHARP